MTCNRHRWQTVGTVAGLISAECDECGSVAVLDRAVGIVSGPYLEQTLFEVPDTEQLALFGPALALHRAVISRRGVSSVRSILAAQKGR